MKQHPVYTKALAEWTSKPLSRVWIDAADAAKLIRSKLKASFPNCKFSVTTEKYAGGASINISWTDGPTAKLVDALVKPYGGSGFDGMTDYKYSVGAWLMPDGSATIRSVEAHYGTDGERADAAEDGAIAVRFGSDFVFTSRRYTIDALKRTAQAYAAKNWGDELQDAIEAGALCISDDGFGAHYLNAGEFKTAALPQPWMANEALMGMAARRMLAATLS